jgi:hypothetical protein
MEVTRLPAWSTCNLGQVLKRGIQHLPKEGVGSRGIGREFLKPIQPNGNVNPRCGRCGHRKSKGRTGISLCSDVVRNESDSEQQWRSRRIDYCGGDIRIPDECLTNPDSNRAGESRIHAQIGQGRFCRRADRDGWVGEDLPHVTNRVNQRRSARSIQGSRGPFCAFRQEGAREN